jgi:hypothetical protein
MFIFKGTKDAKKDADSDQTVRMEAVNSSQTSINVYQTVWRHISEHNTIIFLPFNKRTPTGQCPASNQWLGYGGRVSWYPLRIHREHSLCIT